MDTPSSDVPKLPDMIMCGDHPSFNKTELNVKEARLEEKERPRERTPVTYARITPTSSRTEHGGGAGSEHGLRAVQARRRVRSLEAVPRTDTDVPDNRAMLQAAMGSFRWPPYLLCVWVCVLVLTHALHCIAALLERALPALKKLCQYLRAWTEDSWRAQQDMNHRVCPIGLACATAVLYTVYGLLYGAHAAAIWAIEPLCPDDGSEVIVTNYDDSSSKTNASLKH